MEGVEWGGKGLKGVERCGVWFRLGARCLVGGKQPQTDSQRVESCLSSLQDNPDLLA